MLSRTTPTSAAPDSVVAKKARGRGEDQYSAIGGLAETQSETLSPGPVTVLKGDRIAINPSRVARARMRIPTRGSAMETTSKSSFTGEYFPMVTFHQPPKVADPMDLWSACLNL